MTYYVEGSTVTHLIDAVDWHRDEAVARCGATGEPVEFDDVDDEDLCGNCTE